jgi:hypothetical protein
MDQELLRVLADSSRRSQALLETLVERMSPLSPPSQSPLVRSPSPDISITTPSTSEDKHVGVETGSAGQRIVDAKHDVAFFFEDGSHRVLVRLIPPQPLTPLTYHAQIADVMFRVHGYLFARESSQARQLLDRSADCVDGVIVLEDVEVDEFRGLLSVLYCR